MPKIAKICLRCKKFPNIAEGAKRCKKVSDIGVMLPYMAEILAGYQGLLNNRRPVVRVLLYLPNNV